MHRLHAGAARGREVNEGRGPRDVGHREAIARQRERNRLRRVRFIEGGQVNSDSSEGEVEEDIINDRELEIDNMAV